MTDEFDAVVIQLEPLRLTPDRSEAAARSGLQDLLDQAAGLRPIVSQQPAVRLTGWMPKLKWGSHFTQERSPMLALAIKMILILAVLLGGAGVTAAAAQNSLPHEALYPVKLFVEAVQLSLTPDLDAQIDLQLQHAQQRVHEMVQLADQGAAIPAEVPVRLQTQLQAALQLAAQLNDPAMQAALDRIQLRTQDQLREMDRIQLHDAAWQSVEQALTQTRLMAQLGQSNPKLYRARVDTNRPALTPPQPQITPQANPAHTPQAVNTPQVTCSPQPQASTTPQSYGPGPQALSTPNMGNTSQPVATPLGNGSGQEYGPGSQPTDDSSSGQQPQDPTTSPGPSNTQAPPTPGGSGNGSGTPSGNGGGRP